MRDHIETIRDSGAELVIVGNGSAEFARGFRDDLEIDVPILVDPDLVSYRAAGLRRGRSELLAPSLWSNAWRAYRKGFRQDSIQGDPWQLGATFVFRAGGELVFRHRSAQAGDHADPLDVVQALRHGYVVDDDGVEDPPALQRCVGRALGALLDPTIALSFDRTGFAARSLAFLPSDLDVDLRGRRCVVTGANSGVGFETARALADLGGEVFLLCRNAARAADARARIEDETGSARVRAVIVDMSDAASIHAAAAALGDGPIDRLVHNAGVLPEGLETTRDGDEITFATHVFGPHLLTRLLRDRLCASDDARIVWVSSGGMYASALDVDSMISPASDFDGVAAYSLTKRAQVVLSELWARELAGRATVHAMHPGWADTPAVRTSLPNFYRVMRPLLRTPAEGADTIVWLLVSDAARRTSGEFFLDREARRTHLWPLTRESEAERERLWAVCERMAEARAGRPVEGAIPRAERLRVVSP